MGPVSTETPMGPLPHNLWSSQFRDSAGVDLKIIRSSVRDKCRQKDQQASIMSSRDERDPSASHAPLLAPESSARQHDDTDQSPQLTVGQSSGRFIWYLTFSAGISGLLFGYEYVHL